MIEMMGIAKKLVILLHESKLQQILKGKKCSGSKANLWTLPIILIIQKTTFLLIASYFLIDYFRTCIMNFSPNFETKTKNILALVGNKPIYRLAMGR